MTIKVQTYSNPKNWKNHPFYSKLIDSVHICATNNMVEGIKEAYPEFQHVMSIRKFSNTLFSDWYNQEVILKEFLTLSLLIDDEEINDFQLKQSFKKNTELLLESIRFFVDAGIKPPNLSVFEMTEKEKLFFELWRKLENKLEEFENHRENLNSSDEIELVVYALNKIRDISEDRVTSKNLYVVLHGFYFITPEQHAIINYLKNSNVQITFFNFFEKNYQSTFNFLHAFYSNNFGLPEEREWSFIENSQKSASYTLADSFLSAYEDNQPIQINVQKDIISYNSFFDFLQDVVIPLYPLNTIIKSSPNSPRIIATNADILNEMLLPYYPENNSPSPNILNYPIGKFLIRLHQVYDDGNFILSTEVIIALFSSGWLYDYASSNNAKNYTNQLEKILPYFTNCETMDSWMERIDLLVTQKSNLDEIFGNYPDDRVLQSISSPFSKFSYFNVPIEELQQIKGFFNVLQNMVQSLFLPNQTRNTLGDHFFRLVSIIENHHSNFHEVINQVEIDLLTSLLTQVDDSTQFLYDDIQKALKFYLSSEKNEKSIIIPFIEVDGEAFKNNSSPVYFTGLDEEGLPLGTFDLPWPLQPETFEYLTHQYPNLEMHTLRNKSVKHISRYLLYISLKFLTPSQLYLSWIRNFLDREDLKPALYVKQLGLTEQTYDSNPNRNKNSLNKIFETTSENILEKHRVRETLNSIDTFVEYKQCKKRFYYSYIVESYSDFKDNFIHEFMFSEVVRFVNFHSPNDEYNKSEVRKLFPQWLDYKFNYKYDNTYGHSDARLSEEFRGIFEITNSRKALILPGLTTRQRNMLYNDTKKQISKLRSDFKKNESWTLEATPGKHCKFCPHLDYCDSAKYSIDKE